MSQEKICKICGNPTIQFWNSQLQNCNTCYKKSKAITIGQHNQIIQELTEKITSEKERVTLLESNLDQLRQKFDF